MMKASSMPAQLLLFLFFGFELCSASNILVISTVASPSHSIWCNKLAQLLVNRGHMVTVLDADPPRKKVANLTTYTLEGGYEYAEEIDYVKISSEHSPKGAIDFFYSASLTSCRNMLLSPTFKRFLNEHSSNKKPFDMIIHDATNCECFLGLVPYFGNPKLVLVTAYGESQALYVMGSQGHMIHSPFQVTAFSHPMSFVEKLQNMFYSLYNYYEYHKLVNSLDGYTKEVFGQSTPHVLEIAKSAAVALVNAHPILDGAKYYSPAIIHVPGFHIDEPKKLDVETQEFLDGAKHGAIYFSLDTNLKSSLMSEDKINVFLNVFKNLKQRVLWKFEAPSIKNLPENVKISKWFSQNDVLAHPNMKLFITHCGLLSTQEAIYHGVPIISIPFWMDQHSLTDKLLRKGVAIPLSYGGISYNLLQQAIQEILTNDSYTKEMKRWSKLFTDQPMKPKELAVFWIEHVLRNDNHKYLQPPEAFLRTLELIFFDLKTILGICLGLFIAFLASFLKRKEQRKLKKH
nr:UDP-glucuronosyltransferase 2B17-like [Halyomorpha halys]